MLSATSRFSRSCLHRATPTLAAGVHAPLLSRKFAVRTMAADKAAQIQQTVQNEAVYVYSKTYCPYCTQVKSLLTDLQVPYKVTELDRTDDGAEMQSALQGITGSRTVPQVFINGKFIGGCDDTHSLHRSGQLKALLKEVNINI